MLRGVLGCAAVRAVREHRGCGHSRDGVNQRLSGARQHRQLRAWPWLSLLALGDGDGGARGGAAVTVAWRSSDGGVERAMRSRICPLGWRTRRTPSHAGGNCRRRRVACTCTCVRWVRRRCGGDSGTRRRRGWRRDASAHLTAAGRAAASATKRRRVPRGSACSGGGGEHARRRPNGLIPRRGRWHCPPNGIVGPSGGGSHCWWWGCEQPVGHASCSDHSLLGPHRCRDCGGDGRAHPERSSRRTGIGA
jgi:hypothetical protein